jgi:hypothetical protein
MNGLTGSVHILYFSVAEYIGRLNMGIYKSLTNTWMWKLGPKPRNSFSVNICFELSVLCRSIMELNARLWQDRINIRRPSFDLKLCACYFGGWGLTECGWDLVECGWDLAECGWDLAELVDSRVLRSSGCQCQSRNSPGFDPSILGHSGIWGTADDVVLNKVHKTQKIPL